MKKARYLIEYYRDEYNTLESEEAFNYNVEVLNEKQYDELVKEYQKEQKTLLFVLKSDEDKISFTANEILQQILYEREHFIKIHNIVPEYIEMSDDLCNYLYTQLIENNVIDIDKHEDYNPKTIYGMKIETYFD